MGGDYPLGGAPNGMPKRVLLPDRLHGLELRWARGCVFTKSVFPFLSEADVKLLIRIGVPESKDPY